MKRYRIGEFARQMGVSLDFIKYYEKEGLIHSVQDPANRYHYYDFSQSKIVSLIRYFRSFGYSAQEIAALLRHADAENAAALFDGKAQAHRKRIQQSTHIAAQLDFIARALRDEPDGTWYIIRHPAVYFLPHTNGEDYIDDPQTTRCMRAWNGALPYVYGVDRCVLSDAHGTPFIQHGRAIAAQDAAHVDIPLDGPVIFLPETRCLQYFLDVEHPASFDKSPSLCVDTFEPALRVIRDKRFAVCGDMFIRFLSFYFRDGKQYEKNVLYVPIR